MTSQELGTFFKELKTEVLVRTGGTEFVFAGIVAVYDPQEGLLTLQLEEYVEDEEAEVIDEPCI